jgi:hypothetical protein
MQTDADPDLNLGPAYHFDADADPAFHVDAVPDQDPSFNLQFDADPDADQEHPLIKSPLVKSLSFPVFYLMLARLLVLKWRKSEKILHHLPGRGR